MAPREIERVRRAGERREQQIRPRTGFEVAADRWV